MRLGALFLVFLCSCAGTKHSLEVVEQSDVDREVVLVNGATSSSLDGSYREWNGVSDLTIDLSEVAAIDAFPCDINIYDQDDPDSPRFSRGVRVPDRRDFRIDTSLRVIIDIDTDCVGAIIAGS